MGFWISRVNYTSNFSSNSFKNIDYSAIYKANTANIANDELFGIGNFKDNLKERFDVEPNTNYDIPILRTKPGDIVSHGRSNTHIFHSFDTKNKKGFIDIITEIDNSKKNFYEQEYHISNGSRVLLVTKSNVDDLILKNDLNLNYHEKFGNLKEDAFVLLQSNEIRLISKNGKDINHLMLGEKHIDWTKEFVDILKDYVNKVNDYVTQVEINFNKLITVFNTHTHASSIGPTFNPLIIANNVNLNETKQSIGIVKSNLDNQFKKINEVMSNNVACN